MIDEYAHVSIKATGVTGIVIDIYSKDEKTFYIVEDDERGEDGSFAWDSYLEEELELV